MLERNKHFKGQLDSVVRNSRKVTWEDFLRKHPATLKNPGSWWISCSMPQRSMWKSRGQPQVRRGVGQKLFPFEKMGMGQYL